MRFVPDSIVGNSSDWEFSLNGSEWFRHTKTNDNSTYLPVLKLETHTNSISRLNIDYWMFFSRATRPN